MISSTALIVLLLLLVIFWYWQDALKAQEKAVATAKNACDRMNVQLLDETVMLKRFSLLSLFRHHSIRRMYLFEYTHRDGKRHQSHVILQGKTVTEVGLFEGQNRVIDFPTLPSKSANDSKEQ